MSRQVSRRDFLAGFAASLALLFAPWDRFRVWLGELLARIYEMPSKALDVTYVNVSDLLKRMFPQQRIYDLAYRNSPFYAMVVK